MIGSFADILFQWEFLGVFDFILPFLLIFAIVFGILQQMKIFKESKGINVIIAVVFGLLAARFQFFADFLNVISPRLGIGLVIILALLILIGLFTPEGSRGIFGYILLAVGALIAIIIVAQTFNILGFGTGTFGGFSSSDMVAYIILAVLLIGVIVAVSIGGDSKKSSGKVPDAIKALFE